MNIISQAVLVPPQSVTATGSGPDVPVGGDASFAVASFLANNTAGSTPTLAVVLQHSLPVNGTIGLSMPLTGTATGLTLDAATATNKQQAVTFTTGASTTLQSLKTAFLNLYIAAGAPTGNLTLALYATTTGPIPTGSALATSSTVPVSSIVATTAATAQTVTFSFPTPYDLAASTTYALVVSTSQTADNTNYLAVQAQTVASGGNSAILATSTWSYVGTSNVVFGMGVYVFSTFQTYQNATSGSGLTKVNLTLGSFTTSTTGSAQAPFYPQDTLGVVRAQWTIGGTSSPAYTVAGTIAGSPVNSTPSSSV